MSKIAETGRYLVDAVLRACDVLDAFSTEGELLRLTDVVDRTGLNRATVFRMLLTLEHRGMIERVGNYRFRLRIRRVRRQKYRLGYAAQTSEFTFSRDVSEGIIHAAATEGVELVVLDNRYSPKTALRNADQFIRHKMDLVIEFQTDEHVAPLVSSKFLEARIPFIAVEIPHPGATYYGANNYGAGLIGGRHLGKWAKQRWRGAVDEIILLELPMAGALPRSRLTGIVAGIREALPEVDESRAIYLNGNGQFGHSLEAVRKHLRKSTARTVLVGAINDPSALGALRAFQEVGRTDRCALMGQNASLEARAEMRTPDTRLIGSVAFFPERYGDKLIPLAIEILENKPVPPAVFVKHCLITPDNVNHYYPNDALLTPSGIDTMLMQTAARSKSAGE